MKKLKRILIFIALIIPLNIYADNVSVSPSNITLEVGSSKTFTVSFYDAIGDCSLSTDNSNIRLSSTSFNTGQVGTGETKRGTITVTGVRAGSSVIVVNFNYATFTTEQEFEGYKKNIYVTVNNKQNNNSSNSNSGSNSSSANNNSNNTNTQNQDDKSKNSNLKSITIDGYEVKKIDNNNYELTVPKNVNKINVKAEAEDSKSKVEGAGEKTLNTGENIIEIMITSESGIKNKITLKVTRKDSYSLDDLEEALKDNQDVININISSDEVVSSNSLSKIKESQKKVVLENYDKDKKLLYAWEIDGSKITDFDKLDTVVSYKNSVSEDISKLSNYADGLELNLKQSGSYPKGTKVKLSIKDKYKDSNEVNVYYYDKTNNKLVLLDKYTVKDGYIEIEPINGGDYFITKSTIADVSEMPSDNKTGFRKIFIGLSILILIVITLGIIFILNKRKKKKENNISEITSQFN